MATYSADFNGETTGSFSTNWTNRFATTAVTVESLADAEDDRVHQDDGSGSGIQLWTLDAVDGDADRDEIELVGRVQVATDQQNGVSFWCRGAGSSGSEDGYVLRWNGASIQFWRYNTGTPTSISGTINPDNTNTPWWWYTSDRSPSFNNMPPNLWCYFRMRVNGTGADVDLKARIWIDGQEEPADWQLEVTDSSASRITAVGFVGMGRLTHASSQSDFDYMGVGTAGATAPITVSTNTTVRVTGSGMQVLVSEGDPIVRITQTGMQALVSEGDPVVRITGSYAQVLYQKAGGGGGGSSAEGSLVIAT